MSGGASKGGSRDSRTLLHQAVAALHSANVTNPHLDAELLLAEAAGLTRIQVLTSIYELDESQARRFLQMVAQRADRMPLAYILGRREFYSIEFKVDSNVLIPRPETETLVTAAIDLIRTDEDVRILDIGTGSGAIALALAFHVSSNIVATDISPSALDLAQANAAKLGLGAQIKFILADCWRPLSTGETLGRFDLIISNPPYIAEADLAALEPEVRAYEPRVALTPGPDGLSFYRRIAAGLPGNLNSGGAVLLELGRGQAQAVVKILHDAQIESITLINDLANIPRVVLGRKPLSC